MLDVLMLVAALADPPAGPWFTDIAEESGLAFVHRTGASGQYYMPEITGAGAALLDCDGDGDLDVYLLQSHPLDAEPGPEAANRLFRNDLGPAGPRFVDVTDASGAGDRGYAQGCATGDVDGDGDVDILVTNFGPNVLLVNEGDGSFARCASFPTDDRWSTSAAFFDYDRDGDLDVFIVNYVVFSLRENRICHGLGGRRDYCGPEVFDPVPDQLLRNDGAGRFTDVTSAAGIDRAFGSGLGVVCVDVDRDGWIDVYVANDGRANQLWRNRGDGTFENVALFAGAAYNADGAAEAGMGVDAADFDRDGDDDLFLAHLLGETNTLLVNDGSGLFEDLTNRHGLGAVSRLHTGFGTGWRDFDGDGLLDLFVANGAVRIEESQAGDPYPYGNPNLLMRNLGPPGHRFEVVADPGSVVTRVEVSRGAAFGDIDEDGDVDVVVTTSNGAVRLMRNDVGGRGHALRLRLAGTASSRDALGARVELLDAAGAVAQAARVATDGSYCSASDPRVTFGLGGDATSRTVRVTWPLGAIETFDRLAPDRLHVLREGDGNDGKAEEEDDGRPEASAEAAPGRVHDHLHQREAEAGQAPSRDRRHERG